MIQSQFTTCYEVSVTVFQNFCLLKVPNCCVKFDLWYRHIIDVTYLPHGCMQNVIWTVASDTDAIQIRKYDLSEMEQ